MLGSDRMLFRQNNRPNNHAENAEYYAITEHSVIFGYSAEYSVVLVPNIRLRPNMETPVSVEP